MNYNNHDIFIQRLNSNGVFEEYVLSALTSSLLIIDGNGDVQASPTLYNKLIIGQVTSASHAIFAETASYTATASSVISSSYAVSASYASTSSWAINSYYAGLATYAGSAGSASYAASASYLTATNLNLISASIQDLTVPVVNKYFRYESVYIPDVADQNLIEILNHSQSRALDLYSYNDGGAIFSWHDLFVIASNNMFIDAHNGHLFLQNNGPYNVAIKVADPQYELDINGEIGNSTTNDYLIANNGNNSYFNANGGNLGIGTNSPQFTLDVSGSINFTGSLYKNGIIYVPASASYSTSASYALNSVSASYTVTASSAVSASYATSASYAQTASAIIANTWKVLTWGVALPWTASVNVYEDRNIVGMTGSAAITMSNLYNGWAGVLQVKTPSGSNYSLILPAGTKVSNNGTGSVFITSGSNVPAIDFISFAYDGATLFANIANQWT